jgi:RNA polymerase sigma factor (sigma-70 family)
VEIQDQEPSASTSRRGPSCAPQRPTLEQRLERELERLYRNDARDLRGFVMDNGVSPAEADELVNAAFYAVYRAMEKKAGPLDEPRAYLFKVAIYKMRSRRKRNLDRKPRDERVQQLEEAHARLNQPEDSTNVDDRDELACLAALNHLPARQRQAFLLRYYCGFYPEEIAAVMGIKVDTVDTHLERARRKLADLLGKEEAP